MNRLWPLLIATFAFSFASSAANYTQYVDTRFPDGGEGRIFRGADVPFGMVMWGPSLSGYSLTFLSGAEMDSGFSNNLPILPQVGDFFPITQIYRGMPLKPPSRDSGSPGYFRSEIAEQGIVSEFTTTSRTGMARFLFPKSKHVKIRFYLNEGDNSFDVVNAREVEGYITRNRIRMYFVAKFDRNFKRHTNLWKNIFTNPIGTHGKNIDGATVIFDTRENQEVLMKIGISYVSTAGARLNLDSENPKTNWDFEAVRNAARDAWNEKLSLIEAEGGTPALNRMFYTHLFHTLMHPNIASDVNGAYLGFDSKVHTTSGTHYANYSGWDIYRSWIQLMAFLLPRETSDMMQSLVEDSEQAGGGMPRWPVENLETGTMYGGSATPIVASAYAFGAKNFDVESAFRSLDRSESVPGAHCQSFSEKYEFDEYLNLGFVPYDENSDPGQQSASLTLENVSDEFALSQFAESLGHSDRAEFYLKLSRNWKNLFNPESGYIQPKNLDGSWTSGFDPDKGDKHGFTEGNAHTYTFMIPHALHELFDQLGGNENATAELDKHFTKLNDGSTFKWDLYIGKYAWIGNEPGFITPWEYNWAQAPWKTQNLVRRELNEEFMNREPGDEDLGAMGSWAVWASLGLYPALPGKGGLTIASPIFPLATVHFQDGRDLVIDTENSSSSYIQSLDINGERDSSLWIPIEKFSGKNSRLHFVLGSAPSDWGAKAQDSPP